MVRKNAAAPVAKPAAKAAPNVASAASSSSKAKPIADPIGDFEPIGNEGKGDCGFIAVGDRLSFLDNKPPTAEEDRKPGARMQAMLRTESA